MTSSSGGCRGRRGDKKAEPRVAVLFCGVCTAFALSSQLEFGGCCVQAWQTSSLVASVTRKRQRAGILGSAIGGSVVPVPSSHPARDSSSPPVPFGFGSGLSLVTLFQSQQPESEGDECAEPIPTNDDEDDTTIRRSGPKYHLGVGKNSPFVPKRGNGAEEKPGNNPSESPTDHWHVPEPVNKPAEATVPLSGGRGGGGGEDGARLGEVVVPPVKTRRMVPHDDESRHLRGALWDENHYRTEQEAKYQRHSMLKKAEETTTTNAAAAAEPGFEQSRQEAGGSAVTSESSSSGDGYVTDSAAPARPQRFYPDIDLSISESVYSDDGSVDLVWDLLRWEAYQEAQREPLLVSFLYSTILNHPSLESSLAFLLANRLQSPAMMISTQLQSLILDALESNDIFRRSLRADMMAVWDRDPACNCLPDVFLYFKGFHALQVHRVSHCLWGRGKTVLASFLQSQVSQKFQIDIHPNATLGSGIMLDHGTGIVVGETASIGHNCSILHHVTLGGSGKKGVVRHPQVGDGVLLGAGATCLGAVNIGEGSQIGAGTLVISDLPAHCVAVGVPARIIGSFLDVTEQPSIGMDHVVVGDHQKIVTFESDGI